MKVLFATYPMAFHTPGGGEVQLLAYRKHLVERGIDVSLMDLWDPRFLEHDVVHFFSKGIYYYCAPFFTLLGEGDIHVPSEDYIFWVMNTQEFLKNVPTIFFPE